MNSSDKVKEWRKRTKERIVKAMGGRCALCKYNACNHALALHHLDPNEKDFSFGAIRANPKSWAKLVIELRKCVLVCHNCHSEIHAGIRIIPTDVTTFNEEYVSYPNLNKKYDRTPCPVCGKNKPHYNTTCSTTCGAKLSYSAIWDSINLSELIKIKSVAKIASELGCSDSAVHKRLKKLGLK